MLCAVHDTHTHLLSLTKINPLKPVLVAHWNLTLLQIPWFTYPPSIQFQIGTFQLYRQEVLKYKYLRNPIVISLITMRHNFIHRLHCCKKMAGPTQMWAYSHNETSKPVRLVFIPNPPQSMHWKHFCYSCKKAQPTRPMGEESLYN